VISTGFDQELEPSSSRSMSGYFLTPIWRLSRLFGLGGLGLSCPHFMEHANSLESDMENAGLSLSLLQNSIGVENGDCQYETSPLAEWCRQLPVMRLRRFRWQRRCFGKGPDPLAEWCRQLPTAN
jgi:hypothetical protein